VAVCGLYIAVGFRLLRKSRCIAKYVPRAKEQLVKEHKHAIKTVFVFTGQSPDASSDSSNKSETSTHTERVISSGLEATAGLPETPCTARALDLHSAAKVYTRNALFFFIAMVITWVCVDASSDFYPILQQRLNYDIYRSHHR
jgi:hypothetical protein